MRKGREISSPRCIHMRMYDTKVTRINLNDRSSAMTFSNCVIASPKLSECEAEMRSLSLIHQIRLHHGSGIRGAATTARSRKHLRWKRVAHRGRRLPRNLLLANVFCPIVNSALRLEPHRVDALHGEHRVRRERCILIERTITRIR